MVSKLTLISDGVSHLEVTQQPVYAQIETGMFSMFGKPMNTQYLYLSVKAGVKSLQAVSWKYWRELLPLSQGLKEAKLDSQVSTGLWGYL